MQKGLAKSEGEVDIHHAGTAMRFLTGYFASQPDKKIVLTGSQRMQERPIKVLVEALRSLGADIEYVKEEGYPSWSWSISCCPSQLMMLFNKSPQQCLSHFTKIV